MKKGTWKTSQFILNGTSNLEWPRRAHSTKNFKSSKTLRQKYHGQKSLSQSVFARIPPTPNVGATHALSLHLSSRRLTQRKRRWLGIPRSGALAPRRRGLDSGVVSVISICRCGWYSGGHAPVLKDFPFGSLHHWARLAFLRA